MKRFISTVLCLAVLVITALTASSCGSSAPEKAITGYFEALHNLDTEKLKKFSADGNTGTVDFSTLGDRAALAKRVLYVTFTVTDDGIDESSAKDAVETVAKTSVSYIDCSALFARINGEISISGGEKTKLLAEALDKGEYQTKKADIDIVLVKQDGEWKIPLNNQKNSQLLNVLNVTYIIKWIAE